MECKFLRIPMFVMHICDAMFLIVNRFKLFTSFQCWDFKERWQEERQVWNRPLQLVRRWSIYISVFLNILYLYTCIQIHLYIIGQVRKQALQFARRCMRSNFFSIEFKISFNTINLNQQCVYHLYNIVNGASSYFLLWSQPIRRDQGYWLHCQNYKVWLKWLIDGHNAKLRPWKLFWFHFSKKKSKII